MQITFSSSFKKAFRKKIKGKKDIENKFWATIDIFISKPFDKRLKTHKLSGRLKDLWSFSVEYDLRAIFYFTKGDKAVLIDLGTHDEVY